MSKQTAKRDAKMDALCDILDLAVRQRKGAYTTESDAVMALELIRRLALLLIAERAAGRDGGNQPEGR